MKLTHDGIELRRFPFGRVRRIPFDELLRVEGERVLLADGARLRVEAPLSARVAEILAGPSFAGSVAETGRAFAEFVRGPFGARATARRLLELASALHATDVHLEPTLESAELRLRVLGELQTFCTVPIDVARRLTAALKGLSGCLPYRHDLVQEGRIQREGIGADIRASFVPASFGDRVALRLFGRLATLDGLSLEPTPREALEALLSARTGLVLIAGSTGAGKTTTIYAALAHLAANARGAILSLEDPVEQRLRLAGFAVDQVELAPERGFTGEALLAAALRQDVDVIAVGEIRTPAEARLAVEAAATGRLVLAGIHAGSSDEARQRMTDLGVEPGRLRSALRGVVHQSLRTVRCDCGEVKGCGACGGLGQRRQLVAHVHRVDAAVREAA